MKGMRPEGRGGDEKADLSLPVAKESEGVVLDVDLPMKRPDEGLDLLEVPREVEHEVQHVDPLVEEDPAPRRMGPAPPLTLEVGGAGLAVDPPQREKATEAPALDQALGLDNGVVVPVVEADETFPGFRRSASIIRSASSELRPGGFSEKTWHPASRPATTVSAVT